MIILFKNEYFYFFCRPGENRKKITRAFHRKQTYFFFGLRSKVTVTNESSIMTSYLMLILNACVSHYLVPF